MSRSPLKTQPSFRPNQLMAELRESDAPRNTALPGALVNGEDTGSDEVDIDGGWARSKKRYMDVPKIRNFRNVGRRIPELDKVRAQTATALSSLGMELCAVEGVDMVTYISATEIRSRRTRYDLSPIVLMAPIQRAIVWAKDDGLLPQERKLQHRGLDRRVKHDVEDPAVTRLYLELNEEDVTFRALQTEADILRRNTRYSTKSAISPFCLLGELVDTEYDASVVDDERWSETSNILLEVMPPLLVAGPVGCLPNRPY